MPPTVEEWLALLTGLQQIPADAPVYPRPYYGTAPTTVPLVQATTSAFAEGRTAAMKDDSSTLEFPEGSSEAMQQSLMFFFQQGYAYGCQLAVQKTAPTRIRRPKVNDPEEFKGEKDKFKSFAIQLQTKFNSDGEAFDTESSKIYYAGSYLRGHAQQWYNSHIDEESGTYDFTGYADFLSKLKSAWDDPDAKATADRKLRALRQGNDTCSVYYAKFTGFSAVLEWGENALYSQFRDGLRDEVKDMLVGRDLPAEFDKFIDFCIKIDNSLRAREAERKKATKSSAPTPAPQKQQTQTPKTATPSATPSTASGTHPGPMDLSTARTLSPETKKY